MSFSPDKIIEISNAALISRGSAETLANGLDSDGQAAMTNLLTEWAAVKRKYSHLNGKIAGYVTDSEGKRLAVRNEIRNLLGLPRITDESGAIAEPEEIYTSSNVDSVFIF